MPKQPRSNRPDTPGRPEEYLARGFQFYLNGRHGTFCGQHQTAGYLFHLAVELMLKAVLLEDAHRAAMACIDAERDRLMPSEGSDAKLDEHVADACLEPYRQRAEQLKDEFEHSLDRLWRDSTPRLGKPELRRFGRISWQRRRPAVIGLSACQFV